MPLTVVSCLLYPPLAVSYAPFCMWHAPSTAGPPFHHPSTYRHCIRSHTTHPTTHCIVTTHNVRLYRRMLIQSMHDYTTYMHCHTLLTLSSVRKLYSPLFYRYCYVPPVDTRDIKHRLKSRSHGVFATSTASPNVPSIDRSHPLRNSVFRQYS